MTAEARGRNRKRWIASLLAVGGAALFGVVLWKDGTQIVTHAVSELRYTWPLLLVPLILIGVVLFFAYRVSLPDRGRAAPWTVVLHVLRAAPVLDSLLPLANQGGQIVIVGLLRRWYGSEALVGVAVWTAVGRGVCNILAGVGPAVALIAGIGEPWMAWSLLALSIVMSLPMTAVLVLMGKGLSSRVAKLLGRIRLSVVQKRRDRMLAWASRLDTHLADAVGARKRDFRLALFLRAVAQALTVFEVWLVMKLIGAEGGLVVALLYTTISRFITQLLAFVPGRLGVLEVGAMAGFAALGFTPEAGLELALVLRFRYVVNMLFSASALATTPRILRKYPPRPVGQPSAPDPAVEATLAGTSEVP